MDDLEKTQEFSSSAAIDSIIKEDKKNTIVRHSITLRIIGFVLLIIAFLVIVFGPKTGFRELSQSLGYGIAAIGLVAYLVGRVVSFIANRTKKS